MKFETKLKNHTFKMSDVAIEWLHQVRTQNPNTKSLMGIVEFLARSAHGETVRNLYYNSIRPNQ